MFFFSVCVVFLMFDAFLLLLFFWVGTNARKEFAVMFWICCWFGLVI